LRNDVDEEVLLVLTEREAGRKRERIERRIGVGGVDEGGGCAREIELAVKERLWAGVNPDHGRYRWLVEGWAKVRA